MRMVPLLNLNGQMEDGMYIQALSFCRNNCNKGKCKAFYDGLRNAPSSSRFVTCPYGMSVYYSALDQQIYTGMRERATYQKNKAKNIADDIMKPYNPVLCAEQLLNLIQASRVFLMEKQALDEKRLLLENISHEVKKLNGQIIEHSDLAMSFYKGEAGSDSLLCEDIHRVFEELRSIYLSGSMIESRYSLLDFDKDSQSLRVGGFDCTIYKKFDKIKRIFYNYQKRGIPVKITGSSYMNIYAYRSFELIPLLIIENAVKYSYYTTEVLINFTETGNDELEVTIDSYSPYCSKEEIQKVFEKGFRGKNAAKAATGKGLGLYFVKQICDVHNIEIRVESDNSKVNAISNIAYAPFRVTLCFKDTYKIT